MTTTYGAIYIKNEQKKPTNLDTVAQQTIQDNLKTAAGKITGLKDLDVKSLAKNITLEGAANFTQKYAVAGLTTLLNKGEITNQTMADSLFNGFAPAMDMTAVQMGYNNAMQMKNAVQSGNINVVNFMNGFSGAMSTITANRLEQDYSYLGDEIVIDMMVNIDEQLISETPDRRVQSGQSYQEYIHNLPKVVSFEAKIKEGKNHTVNEFIELIETMILSKEPFTFRAGEKIFENYVSTSFIPQKSAESGLDFSMEIKKIQTGDIEFVKVDIPRQGGGTVKKNVQKQTVGNQTAGKIVKPNAAQVKFITASPFERAIRPASVRLGL